MSSNRKRSQKKPVRMSQLRISQPGENSNTLSRTAIPLLERGNPDNPPIKHLGLFRDAAMAKYGNLAKLMDVRDYYVPPEIPDFEPVAGETEEKRDIRLKLHIKRLEYREKEIVDMEARRTNMFGDWWSLISIGSQSILRQTADFDEVERAADPCQLYLRILDTHLASDTGVTEEDKRLALKDYYNLHMGSAESIDQFFRRFTAGVDALTAADAQMPDDAAIALHFIHSLKTNKYSHLQWQVLDDARKNVATLPATLSEAYQLAVRFKPPRHLFGSQFQYNNQPQNRTLVINNHPIVRSNGFKPQSGRVV